jgi:hypothetical protein
MNIEELAREAKGHLRHFKKVEGLNEGDVGRFELANTTEAVIFTFEANGRTDRIRVTLEKGSGRFLGGEYTPPKKGDQAQK